MPKKKITRKELLKTADEFLTFSAKATSFVSAHLREIKYVGVGIVVIAVGYMGIYSYLLYVNKNGQNAYNKAYYTLMEEMKANPNPDNLREPEELFRKVIDDYGLSKAARLAVPQIAYLKFLDKQYDEAITLYRKFLEKASGDTEYESLANLALANCFEAKGDLRTAIDNLLLVVKAPENPFTEAARLSLARLYRLDGQPEKAKEILEKFVEVYPESPFLPFVKAQL